MNTIVNAVFSEIAHCSHPDHSGSSVLRACIDSKVESLALTGMMLVENNPEATEKNKKDIKNLVEQAIKDCSSSLSEVGYDTSSWDKIENCVIQRGNRLVDMAVDMMTEGIIPDDKLFYEGTRPHRCSQRKSPTRRLKSILKKSNKSKKSRSRSKRVKIRVWKK
jgi:hypothetical protein